MFTNIKFITNIIFTKDRLTILIGMGANTSDSDSIKLVQTYTKSRKETTAIKLVVAAVDIIERSVAIIKNDFQIQEEDKKRIRGFVYDFYNDNIDNIIVQCDE